MTENRKALLLLDYQVALCEDGPHMRMPPLVEQIKERDVLANAARVLAAARRAGWLVVHVRLAFDPTYLLRTNRHPRFAAYPDQRAMLADSTEAQIVAGLSPIDGEPVITVLAAEGIREVVLGGVATTLVVESAARHACDAGLSVTVVDDLCASFRADFHDFSMQNLMPLFGIVTTADELVGNLS